MNFKTLARKNTGSSMCDSGSLYGYHYQRSPIEDNQPLEYASHSPYDSKDLHVLVISLPQLLDEYMTIDDKATRHFNLWCALADPDDRRHYLDLAEEYRDRMVETGRWEDHDGTFTDNSYNWETDFDQVFQIISSGLYGEWHLIQMHNGCDVRGGYTAPVVAYGDLESILCMDRVSVYCPRCYESEETLYRAEENGWRIRDNKQSVSLICPNCKRVAGCYPKGK
jgi:hypothetical protein